jgi:deoxyadenosine/deoxycytidine kinase
MNDPRTPPVKIGIVGPCASGKTTLANELKRQGYFGKVIAQEHSFVQDMWQRLTRPDILIFLQVSFPVAQRRRKMNWSEADFQEQLRRLEHAFQHADLILDTDPLTVEAVAAVAIDFVSAS